MLTEDGFYLEDGSGLKDGKQTVEGWLLESLPRRALQVTGISSCRVAGSAVVAGACSCISIL